MRPRTTKRLTIAAIITVVLATALILRRPSIPKYEITDLGFCGMSGHVSAINNAGQVTGWCRYYSGSPERDIAFVWDAVNGRIDLQTFEGKESFGNGINDKGQVVGSLFETATRQRRAFIWDEETGMTELGTLGGKSSEAQAVNKKGQVVGWAETASGRRHAFIWDKVGGMQDIGTLGGIISLAMDINDKGQVVGLSLLASGRMRAFIWERGAGMTSIGTLGGPTSYASAINNLGQVVGSSDRNGYERAFVWEKKSGMAELKLPGAENYAKKINNQGQILVGFQTPKILFLKSHHGWRLWDPDRGTIDMDSVAPSKNSLKWMGSINDRGQIAAIQPSESNQNHIIILTPRDKQKPDK